MFKYIEIFVPVTKDFGGWWTFSSFGKVLVLGKKNLKNSQQDFKYLLVPSDLQFHSWPCAAWKPELVDLKVHQECREKKRQTKGTTEY